MTPSQAQSSGAPGQHADAAPASVDSAPAPDGPPPPPAVVVRGDATPEEVAVLVAVLAAAAGGDGPASERRPSTWASRSAVLRRTVGHGPGAWRTSLRP